MDRPTLIGFVHLQWKESCMCTQREFCYLFRLKWNENWTLVAKNRQVPIQVPMEMVPIRVRVWVPGYTGTGTNFKYGYGRVPSMGICMGTSTVTGTKVNSRVPVLWVRILDLVPGTGTDIGTWVRVLELCMN